jgi:hypothetical protein
MHLICRQQNLKIPYGIVVAHGGLNDRASSAENSEILKVETKKGPPRAADL